MHARQRGQALPLGLALALVGMLCALVLYNTGRVASDKARLANAADAAAYSGLLWQARSLNFQAYTNRAMIANQVSIAQAVSLRSWASYGSTTGRNVAAVLSAVPPLAVYAQGVSNVLATIESFVDPVAQAMVGVIGLINEGVALSQKAMFASSFVATPEIVAAVARESDPRFDAETLYSVRGMATNLDDWNGFTEEYGRDDAAAMASRTKLINGSLDAFSRERKWRLFENFWFYSTPLTRHKIMREGTTRLIMVDRGGEPSWEWRAVDTVSLQNRIFRPLKSEKKQEVPIGYGIAFANDQGSSDSHHRFRCRRRERASAEWCGRWTPNGKAEKLGARFEEVDMRGYGGLNAFRSLSESSLAADRNDPVITLRTEVALDTAAVRSSDRFVDGERLRADVVAPGDRLSSISAAEVYYRDPEPARGRDGGGLSMQAATGYNPYWDVRLAPVSTEERLIATGLRGANGSRVPGGVAGLPSMDAEAARGELESRLDAAGLNADALPFDPDGGLPGYVATLADAHASIGDLDVAALELPDGLDGDFARFRVEDYVDVDFDPEAALKERLEEELKTAVTRILGGRSGSDEPGLSDEELAQIEAGVEEAKEIARDLEQARKDVARRMEENRLRLTAMLYRRMQMPGFDEDSLFRQFDGYDIPAVLTIASVYQQISLEESPDFPVPDSLALEVAKNFYQDYREQIFAAGRPAIGGGAGEGVEIVEVPEEFLPPDETGEGTDAEEAGAEDERAEDGTDATGEPPEEAPTSDINLEPWDDGVSEWTSICDGDDDGWSYGDDQGWNDADDDGAEEQAGEGDGESGDDDDVC